MTKVLNEVLAANEAYARDFGDKGKLPLPPARRFAILTCMDARLDPAKFAGLTEGDAHVIRNAGGRASDDAIRSLVISHKLLGTEEWFVVHHTDCGMELFTDEIMRSLLKQSLDTAKLDADGWHDVGGKRAERRTAHQGASACAGFGARLRLNLRREKRPAHRGARRIEGRPGGLTKKSANEWVCPTDQFSGGAS